MRWTTYTVAMLLFSVVGLLATYLILRLQSGLPFNPQDLANVEQRLSFNTAVSFTTNTNWQSYVPEVTMSYFSQMAGLATHNFMSAATGIAIAIALVRGFARHSAREIGNFWVDVTRCTLYLLLAGLHRRHDRPGRARRAAEPRRLHQRHDTGRCGPDDRAGAGGVAGADQGARHQRRRFLQYQLRPPVRESDAAHQPDRDGPHLRHPRRSHLHLRQDGRSHQAGVGDLRGDERPLPHRRHGRHRCPSKMAIRS